MSSEKVQPTQGNCHRLYGMKTTAACIALAMGLSMAGCAANHPLPVRGDESLFARPVQADIFPGNSRYYSMGPFQRKENFANVERAQWDRGVGRRNKVWSDLVVSTGAIANLNILQSYLPLGMRWKLKDGREFILENIDVRGISNDYLRKHPIQLQWQREGRARDPNGDYEAVLCFEVKDDAVLLKWAVTINRTPVNQRFTATGAANRWDFVREEYIMATLKGQPTSGIDFNKTREPRK